jgi:hypothetical protein
MSFHASKGERWNVWLCLIKQMLWGREGLVFNLSIMYWSVVIFTLKLLQRVNCTEMLWFISVYLKRSHGTPIFWFELKNVPHTLKHKYDRWFNIFYLHFKLLVWTIRSTEFLGFAHHLVLCRTWHFRNWICFHPQVKGFKATLNHFVYELAVKLKRGTRITHVTCSDSLRVCRAVGHWEMWWGVGQC